VELLDPLIEPGETLLEFRALGFERVDHLLNAGQELLLLRRDPLGLLRVLHGRTVDGGTVLLETYGVGPEDRRGPAIRVSEPGEVYARDDFVYWGFGDAGLQQVARIAGFSSVESLVDVEVDGHPRIMGRLVA